MVKVLGLCVCGVGPVIRRVIGSVGDRVRASVGVYIVFMECNLILTYNLWQLFKLKQTILIVSLSWGCFYIST